MKWFFKRYNELRLTELYELLKLRASVFVVEQDCSYLDLDGNDPRAIHILGYKKDNLVAYSRIFRPGELEKKYASIGRIVIQKQSRGNGIGIDLVKKSIVFCKKQFGDQIIKISAQVYLIKFYKKCGFIEKGEVYLEDTIPHISMYLNYSD